MTRFRKAIRTKRRKAAVIVALLALIPAGALAYFLAPFSQVATYTHTQVGGQPASETVSVSYGTLTGPALTPGGASDTQSVTLSVSGANPVEVTSWTVDYSEEFGGVYDDNTNEYMTPLGSPPEANCQASWFTASVDDTLPITLTPGSPQTFTLTTALLAENVNQSGCENVQPQVNFVIS
jgi:hypothetical protein